MPEGINDQTQLICDSQPFCLCVGAVNEGDECSCFHNEVDTHCPGCGAKLVLIDLETGEPVQPELSFT